MELSDTQAFVIAEDGGKTESELFDNILHCYLIIVYIWFANKDYSNWNLNADRRGMTLWLDLI